MTSPGIAPMKNSGRPAIPPMAAPSMPPMAVLASMVSPGARQMNCGPDVDVAVLGSDDATGATGLGDATGSADAVEANPSVSAMATNAPRTVMTNLEILLTVFLMVRS